MRERARKASLRRAVLLGILIVAVLMTTVVAQTVTTIYDFGSNPHDGANPQAGVIFDKSGNLLGAAALGAIAGSNGVLFQLTPPSSGGVTWTETVLHAFKGQPSDGKVPEGRLVMNAAGKVFGTTLQGGANDIGTVFQAMAPLTNGAPWQERVLYSFGSVSGDGINPNAGLLGANQVLYGVTFGGGAKGRGTVFQLVPTSGGGPWIETILYSFTPVPDAAFPSSELVMDQSGNLYGTTTLGGANNLGAVYQLSPPASAGGAWTETVIHSFNGTDGTLPSGRLQFDASGVLYGTTDGGGSRQEGTVFQLMPPAESGGSWTESVLYNFSGGRDGGNPEAGILIGNQGKLFGTASTGGSGGPDFGGVVFQLTPPAVVGGAWTETVLESFGGPNGFRPISQLTRANGVMYGTTSAGGLFGIGTVFSVAP
jgi:uncharacterized repeat protein (TIGR03803 family)